MPARDDDTTPRGIDEPGVEAELDHASEPDDASEPEAPVELPARVSRQARMGRFLGLGAIVGLLLAVGLTLLWPDDPSFLPPNPELQFTELQVFGFLAVYLVPICLGLGGLIGYFLGRAAEKRSRTEIVIARNAE
ncbi:hypothetical protein [Pseudoclavibacter endophyticus]|uniref:Potassium transporter Trk n=1 Tax=Pseudoclavibacter endophyticus TaxID=1778590 RepID=A0A6H9WQK9_9MICO|nr:hypothetical protein [Pseudoclavibacter endophyticus]KAB1649075.1 hypothetical protein F8O04_01985 [Pseudoclavibacter endophyticus]